MILICLITGVPAMVPDVTVDNNTINITGNNVTLTLSWGEPFDNLDVIVNYTVSCSGDVTCPPNFTTTDNTARSYTITNLTPMTNCTFSVVATNSIGSGEAGVVMITTPRSTETINTTFSIPAASDVNMTMYSTMIIVNSTVGINITSTSSMAITTTTAITTNNATVATANNATVATTATAASTANTIIISRTTPTPSMGKTTQTDTTTSGMYV